LAQEFLLLRAPLHLCVLTPAPRMAGNELEKPLVRRQTTMKDIGLTGLQIFVFFFFIFCDVGKVLAFAWAIKGTAVQGQSIVVMQSITSIIIGICLTAFNHGAAGLKECFDPMVILRFFIVAAMFSINQTLGALQYMALTAATAKVLAQVRLPVLALCSRWIVSRVYHRKQWCALFLITVTAITFCWVQGKKDKMQASQSLMFFGYTCSIVASLCTIVAGLFSERSLKKFKTTPFYTQKVQIEIGGIIVASFMLWFMPVFANLVDLSTKDSLNPFNPRTQYSCDVSGFKVYRTQWGDNAGTPPSDDCQVVQEDSGTFFGGWALSTVVCLSMLLMQSWMAGITAKYMSQVMKQIGQCVSLLLCYFLGDCLLFRRTKISWVLTLIAFAVTASLAWFLVEENKQKEKRKQTKPVPESPPESPHTILKHDTP